MNNQTENPKEEQPLKPKKVWIEPELKQIVVYGGPYTFFEEDATYALLS